MSYAIQNHLNQVDVYADVDGNAEVDALSDGLIILRYLFGIQGDTLIADTISPDATRTSIEEVVAYLEDPNQTPEPPSGEVVPLYNASTALEPETTFTRSDGVIVTRIADRGRDRHHKDSGFIVGLKSLTRPAPTDQVASDMLKREVHFHHAVRHQQPNISPLIVCVLIYNFRCSIPLCSNICLMR